MAQDTRPLALVTGASTGIGYELAKCCAQNGFDLVVVADEPKIMQAAGEFRALGASVRRSRPISRRSKVSIRFIAAMRWPTGRRRCSPMPGAGSATLFSTRISTDIRHIVDTNVTGTIYLIHKVGARHARAEARARILITGSIAGFMPGTYSAVYNGSKAFLDSFSFALAHELKDTGVTVTCLMPGATETEFFERAEHDGYQDRHAQEGRSGRCRQDRVSRR